MSIFIKFLPGTVSAVKVILQLLICLMMSIGYHLKALLNTRNILITVIYAVVARDHPASNDTVMWLGIGYSMSVYVYCSHVHFQVDCSGKIIQSQYL